MPTALSKPTSNALYARTQNQIYTMAYIYIITIGVRARNLATPLHDEKNVRGFGIPDEGK